MALERINNFLTKEEKREVFEWLDNNINITKFIHNYYETIEDIIKNIIYHYPETEQYLSRISNEEFIKYLEDKYYVDYYEETTTTYWIKK